MNILPQAIEVLDLRAIEMAKRIHDKEVADKQREQEKIYTENQRITYMKWCGFLDDALR